MPVTAGGTVADERWASSEPRLVERLRDEILASPDRRITFARFMERALTEPGLGYYATSVSRPTREGDFLTAPELHPLFGRCLGRHLARVWRGGLDRTARFVVREWGAGRGTLEASARAGLEIDDPDLAGVLDWQPVDVAGRHADPTTDRFEGVVLANELVDALPVHRVVGRGGDIAELHVTWRGGWFEHVEGPPSSGSLADHLAADSVVLAEGQLAEVGLAAVAWVGRCRPRPRARAAARHRLRDGRRPSSTAPRRMAGTLMTYAGHQPGDDPFAAVGRQDLTAHVDLTALDRAARAAGLRPVLATRQADFLVGLGLGDLLVAARPRADDDAGRLCRGARVGRAPARPAPPRRLPREGVGTRPRPTPPTERHAHRRRHPAPRGAFGGLRELARRARLRASS